MRLALAALCLVQLLALAPALVDGAWGSDMSLHLAETADLARALAAGDGDLWNASANLGFPSAYYYQSLPQLATALASVVTGGAISIVTLFELSLALPFVLLPLACWRAGRLVGLGRAEAFGVAAAMTAVASSNTWGLGLDSTLTRGIYTQAWAMLFYPLALAHGWRWLQGGRGLAATTIHALLCGLSHPFIAVCLAPALVLTPWWRAGWRVALGRAALLAAAVLAASAFFWLPILVTYDHFGGFPNRGNSEQGIPPVELLRLLVTGEILDHDRVPVLGVLVAAAVAIAIARRHAVLGVLLVHGAVFGALIAIGASVGPTEDDLVPAIRFLAPMQLALAAAAGVAAGWLATAALARARRRLPRRAHLAAAAALAAIAIAGSAVAVRERTDTRTRPFQIHRERSSTDLQRIAAALRGQPEGRVATSELYGITHRNHWWYYLPAVYAGHPVVRAYGAGALQSSPSYRYLYRGGDVRVEQHARLYGIEYLLAGDRWKPAPGLTELARSGRFVLYDVDGGGLVEPARITRRHLRGDRELAIRAWLSGAGPRKLELLALGKRVPIPDGAAATVTEVRRAPSRIAARVEVAPTDDGSVATVLVKESYHPHWRATIDGAPAPIIPVAPAMIAVQVPPGAHELVLSFERPGWHLGLVLLTIAGLGLLVGFERRGRLPGAVAPGHVTRFTATA